MTQQIALAKAAVPVLRERRVIGNLAVQSEPTEPATRQIRDEPLRKAAARTECPCSNRPSTSGSSAQGQSRAVQYRCKRASKSSGDPRSRDARQCRATGDRKGRGRQGRSRKTVSPRRLNAHHRRFSRKSAGFNKSRRCTDDNQSLTFSTVSAHCRRRLGFEPPQSIQGGHRGLRSYVRFGEAARPR